MTGKGQLLEEVPMDESIIEHMPPARGAHTFDALSRKVIGAAVQVHRELGPGFREEIYEEALCIELTKRGLPFRRQVTIVVRYDGQPVGEHVLDLVVDGQLVVELKAATALSEAHFAQCMSYLRAADLRVGLLLNFGEARLAIRRIVNRA